MLHRAPVRPDDGNTVVLTAPAVSGDYELQYYNNENRKVLATRAIRIVEVEVSLSAPESVPMASRISVEWSGPGAERDEVRLFDPDARHDKGQVLHRTRIRPDDGNTVVLVAPAVPGDYELRYYNTQNRKVLATRAIRIEEIEVSLSAPDAVPPATRITVAWTGPGAERDQVRMFDPAARDGQGQILQRQRIRRDHGDDNTVTLDAPELPGDYQLQYYNTDNRKVLATRPLTVE